jgi:23S rRNA (pseudouridine1915-N3)-methyltransferase
VGHLPDISFVSFGKPKAVWKPILEIYEKRLSKAIGFKHVILREKGDGPDDVKANASKLLEPHCGAGVFVVVFDERGKSFTSPAFAKLLQNVRPKKVAVVIGTSYGLADDFLARADQLVNLGSMTLPHEMARSAALEQIYRAETLLAGHPYHHS